VAKRIDLRAYREHIASRLADAQTEPGAPALLGFAAGGRCWLVDLPAAGAVLPVPPLAPVPLTQRWFAGIANVHGNLDAVIDFSQLCGGPPTSRGGAARLLRVGLWQGNNIALLVAGLHGLKRLDALCPNSESPAAFPWCGENFTDAQGGHWTQIDVGRLLADPLLLDAALAE